MSQLKQFTNWRLNIDENNIAELTIDVVDTRTNVLSAFVLQELDEALSEIKTAAPKGLIIKSGKASGFIAGADVTEFNKITHRDQAFEFIQFGQSILDKLEALPCPTVSLIDGFCLGGGLELALACDYRIATDDNHTRVGLPEVKLGIHPGFGGTMRLNRLIGALAAMDLMLTGRTIDARKAKKIGVVDFVVPKRQLLRAALIVLADRPEKHHANKLKTIASDHVIARLVLAGQFRKQVAKQAKQEQYPAPYALIDLWQKHAHSDVDMLNAEAESVAELVVTDTSKNLVRVFFLQEQLKALAVEKDYLANPDKPGHVHVIGAGVMGGDIAAWCAVQGFTVTLQDTQPAYIAPALKRAKKLFSKRFKQKHLLMNALDRLQPDHKGLGVEKADIVIEAIVEDVDIKKSLYKTLEPRLKDNAILATNTSSIELEQLSESLQNPNRLVGIHFFNPVAKMQLVEVVASESTDRKTVDRATTFVRRIDRLPLPVKSSPGFLVNRILMPYLLEAVELLTEGNAAETIDQAALDFGMPMGPITLADTVGLDICLSVATILGDKLDISIPDKLKQMVEQERLGKKNGKGFYDYDEKGNAIETPGNHKERPTALLADRMILRIINEAKACLREGIVESEELLDAGMVFGTGFAPFTGGPMNYLNERGHEVTLQRLKDLAEAHGSRFQPDASW